MEGNKIYTNNLAGYNFISRIDSGYYHIRFNHSQRHFGYTSYIESIWKELKDNIKNLYSTIRANNFIYYISEVEYRHLINLLNKEDKINNFGKVIAFIIEAMVLLSEEELKSIDYDTLFKE